MNNPLSSNIKHSFAKLTILACVAAGISSCNKTPDGVLNQEEMASLMADIHMGEAVIDLNYGAFPNDSTRKVFKQSILKEHGVTQEMLDTSFVWYGNHIEDYIKVYDRTLEILQDRKRDYANAASEQIALSGDSTVIWTGPQHLTVSPQTPMKFITFNIEPDSTWRDGDIYLLTFKVINQQQQVRGRIMADYANGHIHYSDRNKAMINRSNYRLQIDSVMSPTRVYGYIELPESRTPYTIDSIAVTRMRRSVYSDVYVAYTAFKNGIVAKPTKAIATADSVDNNEALPEHHMPTATHHQVSHDKQALPTSSSNSQQSEHRQTAGQHKVDRSTNVATKLHENQRKEATRQKATNRQQAPSTVR
jgi:hypothetical protein